MQSCNTYRCCFAKSVQPIVAYPKLLKSRTEGKLVSKHSFS